MKSSFFENPKLKGILVGGPVPTKDEFVDGGYLLTPLQEKIIGMKDLGNTDESGLKDLVELSKDVLAEQEIIREKKVLEKFFTTLGENPEMVKYKLEDVKKALEYGAVDLVLVSSHMEREKIKELRHLAQEISAELVIISTETTEGEQFQQLSGVGAMLRFKV
jgi:peptide chain release factor subunit 1